jgi:hypothetical protein
VNGFKTQKQLRLEGRGKVVPGEIKIDITRDGEFIYENGKHRLSMAKILSLKEIPVQVVVRHKKWQATRDAIATRQSFLGCADAARLHPDIEYLLK